MAEKTVLILTASRFQFQVWQSALISQKIAVIGGASNTRVPKILEELKIARIPRQHQVAIDGIAVAVNHSLPIDGITIESLRQIYLGQLTNWSQLGGPNLEIVPISRRSEVSGTVEFFQDAVLKEQNFDSKVNYQYSTTEAIRQVNSIPGAIYYGTASEIIPQCTVKPLSVGLTEDNLVAPYEDKLIPPSQCPQKRNRVNQQAFIDGDYPITRNLFVIVERNGERQERIGEAYVKLLLSSEGQSLVEKAGFVPVE